MTESLYIHSAFSIRSYYWPDLGLSGLFSRSLSPGLMLPRPRGEFAGFWPELWRWLLSVSDPRRVGLLSHPPVFDIPVKKRIYFYLVYNTVLFKDFSRCAIKLTLGSFVIKSWALAALAASSISCMVASVFPNLMFSAIVIPNRMGSWDTTPMLFRSQHVLSSFIFLPSSKTWNKSHILLIR